VCEVCVLDELELVLVEEVVELVLCVVVGGVHVEVGVYLWVVCVVVVGVSPPPPPPPLPKVHEP